MPHSPLPFYIQDLHQPLPSLGLRTPHRLPLQISLHESFRGPTYYSSSPITSGMHPHVNGALFALHFHDSISLYPAAPQDGRFMVEFYVAHLNDVHHNATNQWFWLQYRDPTASTFGLIDVHPITPSDPPESRALRCHLVPVRYDAGSILPPAIPLPRSF